MITEIVSNFFANAPSDCGSLYHERSLQLELGCVFRGEGFAVEFERPIKAPRPVGSTKPPKYNLDLLLSKNGTTTAIELKFPMNGRHPETMYDFCADIEFVESIRNADKVNRGFCLMATNDKAFWNDSGRGSQIHDLFRRSGSVLSGLVGKPTGSKTDSVVVLGRYHLSDSWREIRDKHLLQRGRYLLVEIAA